MFSEVSDDEDQEEEEEEAAEAEEEAEAEEGESEVESIHNETCAVCQEGGNVLCCDTCPAVYHLECVNPPLRKVPRGKWSCPQCKTPPQEKERIKLREKSKHSCSLLNISSTHLFYFVQRFRWTDIVVSINARSSDFGF